MGYLVRHQLILSFRSYSDADIPDHGCAYMMSIQELESQTYLDGEFRAVLAPTLNFASRTHRAVCCKTGCAKQAVILSMPDLKSLWHKRVDRKSDQFSR